MESYDFEEKPTAKEIPNQSSNKPTSQPTNQPTNSKDFDLSFLKSISAHLVVRTGRRLILLLYRPMFMA